MQQVRSELGFCRSKKNIFARMVEKTV